MILFCSNFEQFNATYSVVGFGLTQSGTKIVVLIDVLGVHCHLYVDDVQLRSTCYSSHTHACMSNTQVVAVLEVQPRIHVVKSGPAERGQHAVNIAGHTDGAI